MNPIRLIALLLALAGFSCATAQTQAEPDGKVNAPQTENMVASAPPKGQATAPGSAPTGNAVVPLVGEFRVHRFVLDNGLRLLVVEDHSSPTLAYQTWFRVGSRDEVKGRTGLAH